MIGASYTKLLAAYNAANKPRIQEARLPIANVRRSWFIRSKRGWHALDGAQYTRRSELPAVYEGTNGNLYILAAVARLLCPNAFGYRQPDAKIGRSGVFLLTPANINSIANTSGYFCDFSFRSTSAHTTGDTMDIGLWLRELAGIAKDEGVPALVAEWMAKKPTP